MIVRSWIFCFLNFFYSLFLVNGSQTLDENPGCLKCISGINLSSADKNLFTIAFILYFQNKVLAIGKSLRIGTFVPGNLINVDF